MRKGLLFYSVLLFFVVSSCDILRQDAKPIVVIDDVHLTLGNPSDATPDPSNENNYLISLPQYALSYSRSRGTANWVSWHLSEDWLGNTTRQENFRAYNDLPEGWYRVTSTDYEFAIHGFDRGHLCPSGDRTRTDVDNSATFFMINIMPQAPNNNQSLWRNLELYCRRLVAEGNELYIISGVYGRGGTGNKGYREVIANGNVTVPARLWKVVVVLPYGDNDLQRIDENTRVIAIDVDNRNGLGPDWSKFRVSVNEIEAATGFDLLSNVPRTIQAVIESRVDNVVIN